MHKYPLSCPEVLTVPCITITSLLQVEFSSVPGPFGDGLLVSCVQGRAVITATPLANPIFRDVIMSVFNNSYLLDVSLYSRAGYTFYFIKVGCGARRRLTQAS
jgi:hypothetical protein